MWVSWNAAKKGCFLLLLEKYGRVEGVFYQNSQERFRRTRRGPTLTHCVAYKIYMLCLRRSLKEGGAGEVGRDSYTCMILAYTSKGQEGVPNRAALYGGTSTGPKFCMFHKRGLLPLSPVEHTKLRSCTSVEEIELPKETKLRA